ncbi:MAG: monovalent cation/H+ antiporter subunit D family protein [Phycisphaera sp.]|nr:monovalent cation/H+ antiporter subunit D family protein [Phycisphaera sp.]
MLYHLPVLQVVIPLLAAPACVVIRQRHLVWLWATVVTWACLAMSIGLLMRVYPTGGAITYEIGGWVAPWGIVYHVDALTALVLVIVTGVGAVVMLYARQSVNDEIPAERHHLFYAAFLLCMTGLLGITVTGDAFNVFVFLEISSLSSYVLIALGRGRRALTASFRYLVMGTIGGTFILIGIGLMYMQTGTLNMADLAARLPAVNDTRTIRAAFAFFTVGVSVKLALFPLHVWLPNAYTYAPSVITSFVAATATKVSVYVLVRFTFIIFGAEFAFTDMKLDVVLLALAIAAMFIGSLVAIYQTNVKRLLAYSSLAQIGYMVLGISLTNVNGLTGSIVHLFNHAMMKGGLFMVMGCVMLRIGSVHLRDMAGLGKRMPWTMAAFVVGGLNLIGVPLTSGFVSKWYLVLGALDRGWWPIAVLILLSSLLAVVYVWRVIEVVYFRDPPEDAPTERCEAPLMMLVMTWLLLGASIVFGVWAQIPAGVSKAAAQMLLGVTP